MTRRRARAHFLTAEARELLTVLALVVGGGLAAIFALTH
jgi:hypothetical protein